MGKTSAVGGDANSGVCIACWFFTWVVKPAAAKDFLQKDIDHLINTFKWTNK